MIKQKAKDEALTTSLFESRSMMFLVEVLSEELERAGELVVNALIYSSYYLDEDPGEWHQGPRYQVDDGRAGWRQARVSSSAPTLSSSEHIVKP